MPSLSSSKLRNRTFDPRGRLQWIETWIHSWNFRSLLEWVEQRPERWTTREELMICYARERLGELESWQPSMARLRQRVFVDAMEHLAFRALSLQTVKDLRRVAAELKQIGVAPTDLLFQIAWVRVADRLALLNQLEEAHQLYHLFAKPDPSGEWQCLTTLKGITLAYLMRELDNESLIQLLRGHLSAMHETPLARIYFIALHLYVASISTRWFDQVRLQNQLRKALLELSLQKDQPHLYAVANYLLNPEQGLGAALWRGQLPHQSPFAETAFEFNPEMLWFSQCIEDLEYIQEASQQQSISALQSALKQQEIQGNGLLAACARCRLLGIMVHQYRLRDTMLAGIWQQELRLLQAMPYAELRSFGAMLEAAHQYRQGQFQECLNSLRRAKKLSQDRLRRRIIALWLAHARGRMPRNLDPELSRVGLQLLRYFFSPSLKSLGNSQYLVSEVYPVDLSLYPVLNRLIQQILRQPHKALMTQDVQDLVWRQTSSMEGWKQKLRNTVARLRFQFRFMLTPLVIQTHGVIHLNADAMTIEPGPAKLQTERAQEILRALQQGSRSIEQLLQITRIPSSTLRRYMRDMENQGLVIADGSQSSMHYGLFQEPGSRP